MDCHGPDPPLSIESALLALVCFQRGQKGVSEIVDKTGGITITAVEPGEAFRDSVHYLRSGYTMYYALPAATPGAERRLQAEPTSEAAKRFPNMRIRARSGYIAP